MLREINAIKFIKFKYSLVYYSWAQRLFGILFLAMHVFNELILFFFLNRSNFDFIETNTWKSKSSTELKHFHILPDKNKSKLENSHNSAKVIFD